MTATEAHLICLALVAADFVARALRIQWILRGLRSRIGFRDAVTLNAFGDAVLSDPELLAKLDKWLTDAALYIVERYQDEVGQLIAQTVQAWDPEATSRRIELAIGRDLQFIRINGTIVGGLAGAGIYLLSKLI